MSDSDQEKIEAAANMYWRENRDFHDSDGVDVHETFKAGVAWRDANPKQSPPTPEREEAAREYGKQFELGSYVQSCANLAHLAAQDAMMKRICGWMRSKESPNYDYNETWADAIEELFGSGK